MRHCSVFLSVCKEARMSFVTYSVGCSVMSKLPA